LKTQRNIKKQTKQERRLTISPFHPIFYVL